MCHRVVDELPSFAVSDPPPAPPERGECWLCGWVGLVLRSLYRLSIGLFDGSDLSEYSLDR